MAIAAGTAASGSRVLVGSLGSVRLVAAVRKALLEAADALATASSCGRVAFRHATPAGFGTKQREMVRVACSADTPEPTHQRRRATGSSWWVRQLRQVLVLRCSKKAGSDARPRADDPQCRRGQASLGCGIL